MRISGYDEDNLSQSLGKFMIKDVQQIKKKFSDATTCHKKFLRSEFRKIVFYFLNIVRNFYKSQIIES